MFQKKISPFVLCLVSLKTAVAGKGFRFPSCSNFFPIYIFVPIRFWPKNKLTCWSFKITTLSCHNRNLMLSVYLQICSRSTVLLSFENSSARFFSFIGNISSIS